MITVILILVATFLTYILFWATEQDFKESTYALIFMVWIFMIIATVFGVTVVGEATGFLKPATCGYYKEFSVKNVPAKCLKYFDQKNDASN